MPNFPEDAHQAQYLSFRRLIENTSTTIRKQNQAWFLHAPARKDAIAVPPAIVAELLAKGHLVPSACGGLKSRNAVAGVSHRLTSHRPPRPEHETVLPSFNDAESPLAWLRSRQSKSGKPLIGDAQFLAGERLRADYERSCLERRTTSSWDISQSAGGTSGNRAADLTDAMIAARQSFHAALDAVGPELSGMLVQVCCLSAGIEQAERLLDMPQRAGKAVLGLALTSLARHYGFLKPASGSERGMSISRWATEDYRPAISPQAAAVKCSAGVGFHALDHRRKAIGALLCQMSRKAELIENGNSVDGQYVLRGLAGIDHEGDGYQTFDDQRVTVAHKFKNRIGAVAGSRGHDPHLAGAATHLVGGGAKFIGQGGQQLAKLDHMPVTVFPIVEKFEVGFEFVQWVQGNLQRSACHIGLWSADLNPSWILPARANRGSGPRVSALTGPRPRPEAARRASNRC